jgi:glycosyltransferase involved in cell wall biosynthesis
VERPADVPATMCMRVLLLSRYGRLGASSRVRSYQYQPYLRAAGIEVTAAPLFDDFYLEYLYGHAARSFTALPRAALRRLQHLLTTTRYDLLWVEYELFPWAPALLERLLAASGQRYVVEFDDAVFHRYDRHHSVVVRQLLGRKIDVVMRKAAAVIAGNPYLAARARVAGARRIEHLPSVIDLDRYPLAAEQASDRPFTIGWIGSPATAIYLHAIAPALREVCADGGTRVRLIGAPSSFELPGIAVEHRVWVEAREAEEIQAFDIGIMPLPNGPWERGKCGYKLIQYMACGKAVVASPVGVNEQIVAAPAAGLLASNTAEWTSALRQLRADRDLRAAMGREGRRRVEQGYSLQVMAPRLAALFHELAPEGA